MTREVAIKGLKAFRREFSGYEPNEEMFDMAIKALEQTDCGKCEYLVYDEVLNEETGDEYDASYCRKQQPCEDCISRKAVLDCFKKWQPYMATRIFEYEQELKALPSIQPKPKTGNWIIKEGREQGYDIAGIKTWYIQIMCDKCGFIKTAIEGHTGQYHFCPNCGTKMESEDKE